ncbi:MAG: ROK family protein [Alphaproteobacteria bacterium]|nr:ROK family protein [Alphaproteobacteria bacterium]
MSDRAKQATGLAVDFGGTKIAAARLLRGEVVSQVQVGTEQGGDTDTQINAMCELLNQLGVTETDRIGVAVTGRVTASGIWQALNSTTLPNIGAVELSTILSRRFGRQVTVLNDATAGAIGEQVAGAGRGCNTMGFITVSTGIGGGFILDGKPLMSDSGLAGHVGFTTSRLAGGRCGSGRLHTIESIASGKAIARMAAEKGHGAHDAKTVYEAHLAGEKWASDLVGLSASAVAELCANLNAILDPELIVIGGSIGLAKGYVDLVAHYLRAEPEIFRVPVKPASLGVRGTFIGALWE